MVSGVPFHTSTYSHEPCCGSASTSLIISVPYSGGNIRSASTESFSARSSLISAYARTCSYLSCRSSRKVCIGNSTVQAIPGSRVDVVNRIFSPPTSTNIGVASSTVCPWFTTSITIRSSCALICEQRTSRSRVTTEFKAPHVALSRATQLAHVSPTRSIVLPRICRLAS